MSSGDVLLFLFIPKTASSTLNYCIHNEYYYGDDEYPRVLDDYMFYSGMYWFSEGFFKSSDLSVPQRTKNVLTREDLRMVLGHFWFGLHNTVGKTCKYVTLLRDPVERVLSLYQHLRDHGVPKQLPSQGMTLDEFINTVPFREIDNDQTRRISGMEPETGACSPVMLQRAKENLRRHFALVGVTEQFDESLVLMKRLLGWKKELHYYRKNESPQRLEAASLPRSTLDLMRDRNALDIELYAFATQLLQERIAAQDASFRDEVRTLKSGQQARHAAMLTTKA